MKEKSKVIEEFLKNVKIKPSKRGLEVAQKVIDKVKKDRGVENKKIYKTIE